MEKDENKNESDKAETEAKILYFKKNAASAQSATTQGPAQAKEPFINLPATTKALVLGLLLIHAAFVFLLPPVTRFEIYNIFGFTPARFTIAETISWTAWASIFTFTLLHGSWLHVIMNSLMLAALGTGVERWLGSRKMLVLFLLSNFAAVLTHFALNHDSLTPVVGASGGISGLFAAVLVMMQDQIPAPKSRFGLWPLIIVWIIISVIFGFMGGPDGSAIAWEAHIGGFLAGLALIRLLKTSSH